jgi:hypothetical protein
MNARAGTTLLALASLATGLAGLAGCGASLHASCGAAARVPLAPPGVYVDDEVADGYATYRGALADAGTWASDATYGVHWCPARPDTEGSGFRPYVSRGHWTTSEQPAYGAEPGEPYWTSDDAAPWTDITTHHGWWIDTGHGEWCWVPGHEQTPARVVWRSGDGFVGWAAEPPTWVDDGGDDAAAGFEWAYELLGTLLENDGADGYVLTGDAALAAAQATAPSGRYGEPGVTKRPPAKPVVNEARQQLVAYLRAHPDKTALANAAVATASSGHASGSSGHSGGTSSGSSSSSSSSTTAKRRKDSDDTSLAGIRLPTGGVIVTMMMSDPVAPPVRLGSYGHPGATFGGGGSGAGWSGSPSGGSTVQSGHVYGSSAPAPAPVHAASHGASSYSHGGGGSSSSSSSSSHTSSSGSSHKR